MSEVRSLKARGVLSSLSPPPGGWGNLSRLLGKNIKLLREEKDFVTVGKNITWKKGKQYNLPYNIKAAGKNIKWGRAGGDGNFGEENQDLKQLGWGRI